jgi:hypothetical protein
MRISKLVDVSRCRADSRWPLPVDIAYGDRFDEGVGNI